METRLEIITPGKAKEYLKRNTLNFRKISMNVVNSYANDMIAGKWQFNGEPIQFDTKGNLVNGQHRLAAIIKSDCNIPMLIVEGVDANIFDFGKTRSAASYGNYQGIKNATCVMGVANLMLCGISFNKVSKGMQIDYGVAHAEEITNAINICANGAKVGSVCKKAAIVTVAYCLLKLGICSENEMREFCKIANTGNAVSIDRSPSPALVFSRQIGKLARSCGKDAQSYVAEVFYKAIMDYAKGNTRQKNYLPDPKHVDDLITRTRKKEIEEERM